MTIEELRVIISAKTEGLQEGISKATSRLEGFRKTSDGISSTNSKNVEKMKSQYDSLIKKLDNVNAQAELQQRKLSSLREKHGRMSGFNADSPKTMKLEEQILSTESKLQRLIETSDKTVGAIHEMDNAMGGTAETTHKSAKNFDSLKNKLQQIKDKFKQTGDTAQKSTGKVAGFATMLNKSFMRIIKRIFIFNLIYKMIRGLIGYLTSALNTNKQFVNSLNTIKTNLKVAFQPIHEFILPAIQALMRALATLTGYIASFTSALFGKTYTESFKAAKGIEKAKKEMDGYGGAAKKAGKDAKGALAGFDEINTLNAPSPSDDSGGGGGKGHELELPDLTQIDEGPITRLKQLLADMFEPFKKAWDNEGQNTIESAKRALNSMKELIMAIGKSFKEVWTNGSGQDILETLLRILQNLFDLVSKIADSFRIAWEENETGTKIIQGIADIFNIILGIIESIGESLNDVWGEVGQGVANTFLAILESTVGILKAVAEGLRAVWDNGGQHLFESLIKLGAKIFELAGYIYTKFVAPFVVWFIELISPAIGVVMDWIAKLLDKFIELIDWLLGDGKPVLDTIVTTLGIMAIAFGTIKAAILLYNIAIAIATGVTTAFTTVIAILTSPVTLVIAAITALIAISVVLYNNWDKIGPWIKNLWEGIKTKGVEIWGAIKNYFVETWNNIKKSTEVTWNGLKTFIANKWDDIRKGIASTGPALINAVKSPFNAIKTFIDGMIRDAFNWGKNLIGGFIDGIKSMAGAVGNAVKGVAGKIGDFIGFQSPTKEGPGRYADKWMPNLMDMLVDGIENNVYKVNGAVDVTANALRGVNDSDSSNPSSMMSNQGNQGDTTIIVKIGEDTLTEKVVSGINRQSRISGKTIITV